MATSITLTTNSASTEYTLATGGRGPAGATGPAGAAGTSLTAGTGIDITEGVVSSTVTGNATHTGDATGSTALTLATVNGNIGSFTNASITVNAKGLVTAASNGTTAITTITGTANQITVSGAFASRTLSLPATINVNTTGNAATVTTNANLTGPVTSTGNATAIANGAISNAMLANGAVTNLSGTNTGDETAARIATALNAGTADSTAADTDKLAVTHPAGGWMLLSTLWSWIEAKINTLAKLDAIVADATLARTDDSGGTQTFAGLQAFGSTTRPTSSGTGTPASDSLVKLDDVVNYLVRDARTYLVNYPMGITSTAAGGTSTASRGYWQLFTSATAGSKAQVIFDMTALVGNGLVISFDRRIVVSARINPQTLRSGLQYYCQLGRYISETSAAKLTGQKGFGFGVSGSTVTPFVNSGSGNTDGATFSVTNYPWISLDFVPGVGLYVYGQTLTSTTPVLLSTISTGLPTGSSTATYGQLEFLLYDTGAGGASCWFYLGQASMTAL